MATIIGFDKTMFKRCTCSVCGAIVEFTEIEIEVRIRVDYTGGRERVRVLVCPNCAEDIVLQRN